jgi:hypothetical protein
MSAAPLNNPAAKLSLITLGSESADAGLWRRRVLAGARPGVN